MEMKSIFAVWCMFYFYYVYLLIYLFSIYFVISYLSIENVTVWHSKAKQQNYKLQLTAILVFSW